jgi:hypothetical protein
LHSLIEYLIVTPGIHSLSTSWRLQFEEFPDGLDGCPTMVNLMVRYAEKEAGSTHKRALIKSPASPLKPCKPC